MSYHIAYNIYLRWANQNRGGFGAQKTVNPVLKRRQRYQGSLALEASMTDEVGITENYDQSRDCCVEAATIDPPTATGPRSEFDE